MNLMDRVYNMSRLKALILFIVSAICIIGVPMQFEKTLLVCLSALPFICGIYIALDRLSKDVL